MCYDEFLAEKFKSVPILDLFKFLKFLLLDVLLRLFIFCFVFLTFIGPGDSLSANIYFEDATKLLVNPGPFLVLFGMCIFTIFFIFILGVLY